MAADRWRLEEPLRTGHDLICAGIIIGPGGAYCDFSDSESWTADEVASMERLLAEANAAEVYRKALEPFAALAPGLLYPEADVIWIECGVPIPSEHWTALREACKLMGIEVPGS